MIVEQSVQEQPILNAGIAAPVRIIHGFYGEGYIYKFILQSSIM